MAREGRFAGESASGEAAATHLHELTDGVPQTIFEVDLHGRLRYANRHACQVFGLTAADLEAGLDVADLFVREERERLLQNLAGRLRGDAASSFEHMARRRDGSTFPAMVQTTVVHHEGQPRGLVGYLIDISERLRVEGALHRRLFLDQLLMSISNDLVTEMSPRDLDARVELSLRQIGRALGGDRSYVFLFQDGGAFMDNTHEWVSEGISAERANLQHLSTATGFSWFVRELRSSGVVAVNAVAELPDDASAERAEFQREGIRSLLCVAMKHEGNLGGFLGIDAVRATRVWSSDEIGFLRVLGGMIMGAIVRSRSEAALQESERKYKALVENTTTGFVILDQQGRVLDANAEYVRVSGHRSLEEIRGRSVGEWTAEYHRERNANAVAVCVRDGQVNDLQIDYRHADGTVVPVLINASVTMVDGSCRIVSLLRDISDRKRLEEEQLRSEKLRSVGVFAGGIAHDFNNILTAILGNVSLLQLLLPRGADAREHLDEIESAAKRARDLTRQLLTFSRGGDPVRRPFHPEAVVRESVALALRGRASTCRIAIAPGLWAVQGDEGQLGQVIRNLVINASQAMAGGGAIALSAQNRSLLADGAPGLPAGDYVAIAVADQGQGIAPENRLRIFDPYFTTKHDGRGLGLAVCHSVVKGHGGAITVDSTPGEGAVFTVYLPAATEPVTPAPVHEAPVGSGQGRVLVMDDEEDVRSIAAKILRVLGYQVALATDGRDAIAQWQAARERGQPFDVAILDLTVPGGLGGREAARKLRGLDPDARIIVSSGYGQDPVLASYREHGFCEMLAKPFDLADVGRTLAAVLAPAGP